MSVSRAVICARYESITSRAVTCFDAIAAAIHDAVVGIAAMTSRPIR